MRDLSEKIKQWGMQLGFQQVGITNIDLATYEPRFLAWLEQGFHGEMSYMTKHGSKRTRPAELIPNTIRIISARLNYLPADTEIMRILGHSQKGYVSRYALGRDYHKLMRQRLDSL